MFKKMLFEVRSKIESYNWFFIIISILVRKVKDMEIRVMLRSGNMNLKILRINIRFLSCVYMRVIVVRIELYIVIVFEIIKILY